MMVSFSCCQLVTRLTRVLKEPPEVAEDNDIHKTLSAIGVKYSHRNDDVLLPSRIEEERSRNALKVSISDFHLCVC
jgi:hypothetical protein